jgi:hypothetical protein
MELGKNFLRYAAKLLLVGLKRIPGVGMAIEVAEGVAEEEHEEAQVKRIDVLEEKLRELEEASQVKPEEARQIAYETAASLTKAGKVIEPEKVAAVADILSVMPATIAEKTKATITAAKKRGTSLVVAIPLDPKRFSESDRKAFYHSLIPSRRPQFTPGSEVPFRPGWMLQSLLGMGGFGEVWKVHRPSLDDCLAVKFCLEEKSARLLAKEGKKWENVANCYATRK